jgi:hypothetical protein
VEYLVVWFYEDRGVIVNSASGAWRTNQMLMLEAGTYTFALAPPTDYTPPELSIVLENTTVVDYYEVFFTKAAHDHS